MYFIKSSVNSNQLFGDTAIIALILWNPYIFLAILTGICFTKFIVLTIRTLNSKASAYLQDVT